MFIAAVFTRAEGWKQATYPLRNVWINTVWYTRAMEYYAAFKKNI
jgi:hypothetical protein